MHKIITIGREFGSGGRELGRRLSENLQFAYYDQEIVTEIAKRTKLSEEYVRWVSESRPFASFPIHVGRSFCVLRIRRCSRASRYSPSSTGCSGSFRRNRTASSSAAARITF